MYQTTPKLSRKRTRASATEVINKPWPGILNPTVGKELKFFFVTEIDYAAKNP